MANRIFKKSEMKPGMMFIGTDPRDDEVVPIIITVPHPSNEEGEYQMFRLDNGRRWNIVTCESLTEIEWYHVNDEFDEALAIVVENHV